LLGAVIITAVSIASTQLPFLTSAALAQEDGSSLAELKKQNAQLREELAALRERDRLKSEIATVRARRTAGFDKPGCGGSDVGWRRLCGG